MKKPKTALERFISRTVRSAFYEGCDVGLGNAKTEGSQTLAGYTPAFKRKLWRESFTKVSAAQMAPDLPMMFNKEDK